MKKLEELNSLEIVKKFITERELSFIYVTRPECGVCHAVLAQLRQLLNNYPQIHLGKVNANDVEEVAAKYLIFTVPSLVLFVEGKEALRIDRFVHFAELEKQLDKIYDLYGQFTRSNQNFGVVKEK